MTPLEIAAIAGYEAYRLSIEPRLGEMPPWEGLDEMVRAAWRAAADAAQMAYGMRAAGDAASVAATPFPRCPTHCDDFCEQPCHEVHDLPPKRDHDPEVCVGSIVAAARADQREQDAALLAAYRTLYDAWENGATVEIDLPGYNGISYGDSNALDEASDAIADLLRARP